MDTKSIEIVRYDGTRYITEEEIDREYAGQWVLVRIDDDAAREGYLIASAEGRDELRSEMSAIAILEFNSQAKVIYGCRARGSSLGQKPPSDNIPTDIVLTTKAK